MCCLAISRVLLILSSSVPEPILKDLQAGDWYALGLNLEDELDCIEKDVMTCRRLMFRKWLKRESTTHQQLVEALEAIGEETEAARLRKKYGKSHGFDGYVTWSLSVIGAY